MPANLILLRHGESDWNLKNLFTGWVDVDLTATGEAEGAAAASCWSSTGCCPMSCTPRCCAGRSAPRRSRSTSPTGTGSRCGAVLAAQRAPLRRAAGQGQGAGAGRVRRRAVHAAGAAPTTSRRRRWPPTTRTARSATRATPTCSTPCRAPSAWPTSSAGCCRTGTTRSCPTCGWADGAGRRARQLAARADQAPGRARRRRRSSSLNVPTGIPLHYELDPTHVHCRPRPARYLDPAAAAAAIEAVANQGKK